MSIYKPQTRRRFIASLASASMILPGMLHELMAEPLAPGKGGADNPLTPGQLVASQRLKRRRPVNLKHMRLRGTKNSKRSPTLLPLPSKKPC